MHSVKKHSRLEANCIVDIYIYICIHFIKNIYIYSHIILHKGCNFVFITSEISLNKKALKCACQAWSKLHSFEFYCGKSSRVENNK